MADNVNETSNIERVDNSDPFENSSKMPAWELAYIRQEYQIYDGPYSDDDDRKWTDSSNWKSNPNYIDDEEEFKKVYSGGTDDTEYKRSTKVSPNVNTMDYITIATLGNAIDFGDAQRNGQYYGACASSTRGCYSMVEGSSPVGVVSDIDYIQFASVGDAIDFGDLSQARTAGAAGSNGHGGL